LAVWCATRDSGNPLRLDLQHADELGFQHRPVPAVSRFDGVKFRMFSSEIPNLRLSLVRQAGGARWLGSL
jgi:hypothetical protein